MFKHLLGRVLRIHTYIHTYYINDIYIHFNPSKLRIPHLIITDFKPSTCGSVQEDAKRQWCSSQWRCLLLWKSQRNLADPLLLSSGVGQATSYLQAEQLVVEVALDIVTVLLVPDGLRTGVSNFCQKKRRKPEKKKVGNINSIERCNY